MSKGRVAVAMSGGVDSSVAAALLKQAGYEVYGIYLQLWSDPSLRRTVLPLERTCQVLGIPLYKLDLKAQFRRLVIDYFCQEYSLGRTPNPCIVCNQRIKFGLLLDRARKMGAEYLATGHYARIERSAEGFRLLKAVDQSQDQSYFLYTLGKKQLEHLLFPLGGLSKKEVRGLVAKLGLPVANQRESRDICFIPDNDYRAFISEYITPEGGEIVDIKGKVLGKHSGLARYTVGQRHGLGLSSSKGLYVLRLNAENNRLVVGNKEQSLHNGLTASKLSWVVEKAAKEVYITTKVRYKMPEVAAKLHANGSRAKIMFNQPQLIAPGQSVVFYQGDVVLGGGIIDAVLS